MPPILTAPQTLYLHQVQTELAAAPHGGKAEIVQRAAAHLGVSVATVQRWLKEHMGRDTGRKRRADAGRRDVSDADLTAISAALLGTFRKTGNRIMTFDTAVEMLRANGVISTTLTAGRLATVLTERGLHPNQLTRPEPAIEQRSLHPNHVWQVDASVCVAYYLSNATGLHVMDEKQFYKNKPGNVSRIQQERLIRYTVADHFSHELLTRYYLGSECALHLTDFLIWAMQPKTSHIVHGVPFIVQMDMGSANTSAMTKNLLERLDVRLMVHERHNSRANGSVEKAHHLVEINFESALKFARVQSLEDLNEKALVWANHFGATRKHSRLGKPRHDAWMTITADQLRLAPEEALMRELVGTHPVDRRVSNNLTVTFSVKGHGSAEYDVRHLPGVMAGAKVPVVVNAFRVPAVDIGHADPETGELLWMTVEPIALGADNRRADAPVIGQQLRAAPRGLLEHNRDAVMQLAYGGQDADEAAQAQEKGALVFGGEVDPFKVAAEAKLPAYLPRRGTEHPLQVRQAEVARLNVVEACKRLLGLLGEHYTTSVYAWMSQRFGDEGVPEDQIDALAAQFRPAAESNDQAGQGGLQLVQQPRRAAGGEA
ncbi:UNVERIFIED_ORG: hypothetical protein LHJ69_14305 [Shinella sp. XGS7]|nr:hypothetical protein [Shinella sp. XGS7]